MYLYSSQMGFGTWFNIAYTPCPLKIDQWVPLVNIVCNYHYRHGGVVVFGYVSYSSTLLFTDTRYMYAADRKNQYQILLYLKNKISKNHEPIRKRINDTTNRYQLKPDVYPHQTNCKITKTKTNDTMGRYQISVSGPIPNYYRYRYIINIIITITAKIISPNCLLRFRNDGEIRV